MIEFKVAEKGQLHSAILNAPIEYNKDGYMVTITPINGSKKAKNKSGVVNGNIHSSEHSDPPAVLVYLLVLVCYCIRSPVYLS